MSLARRSHDIQPVNAAFAPRVAMIPSAHPGATHDLEKWSKRRALAFIVTSSALLWTAIIAGGAQAVHLFA